MEGNEEALHHTERERNTKLKWTKKLREKKEKKPKKTKKLLQAIMHLKTFISACLLASTITTPAQVVFAETN
jgi:hypothetical protein